MGKDLIQIGSLNIVIDDAVPCLKKMSTGEIVETYCFKMERKNLSKFTEKAGWNINWAEIPDSVEVFALATADNEIQGLIGIKNDQTSKAAYLHWACTAPHNDVRKVGHQKKYEGVGGHLFAIAAEKSMEWGYEGAMHGFAANKKLLNHYIEKLGAVHLGMLHEYQIFINEKKARELKEVYTYEWRS